MCAQCSDLELTTPENTITCHNALFLSPQNFASALSSASLWAILTPRETEDNAYAKFWGDKQRALWYVMVFSGVVNRSEAVDARL